MVSVIRWGAYGCLASILYESRAADKGLNVVSRPPSCTEGMTATRRPCTGG